PPWSPPCSCSPSSSASPGRGPTGCASTAAASAAAVSWVPGRSRRTSWTSCATSASCCWAPGSCDSRPGATRSTGRWAWRGWTIRSERRRTAMGKGDRAKSAREKIAQQRAADQARERRKKLVTYVTAGAVALAAVGAGWWYAASRSQAEQAAETLAPITVNPEGDVVMAKEGVTKPVVDIYVDYQCPACRELERVSGATFKNLA